MNAGGIVLTVDRPAATSDYLASLRRRDRVFWAGFAGALLAHALLIIGIGSANQRTLGTPEGASDAIAVELVDAATLKDSMEPPTPAQPPPGAQPQQQQTAALPEQQPVEPQPEQQAEQTPPEPPQPPTPEPEAAQPAEAPPVETPAPDAAAEALPALEDAPAADALKQPKEAPKQEEPKPEPPKQEAKKAEPAKKPPAKQQAKQPQKKRTQTSALDLSVPYDGSATQSDAGSSSAVQRPPGITRSGENDEFARNVIRALQKTMPRERARGRVTVRIVLNENGSRADVKLLKSGGDSDLDFNVIFAARQTAYPFPPRNATLVDRTFTVTYIYR
ncbi:TonB family protein [Hyphomicrobium sp. 1Nfss2.1]|uniref:energy transducer TonB family protein n=1 Tax=Hyphomicrobium sp. 1Nfss2.1 TaxID=3413936 RepID=UPI003C7AF1FD